MIMRKDVTILDGGMGHQLRRMGVEVAGPIGSQRRFLGVALANVERPSIVRDAHEAYVAAGARVITTNNYALVPATLALADGSYSDQDLEELVTESALLARQVADASSARVRVAGSMPPLRESYRHEQVPADTSATEATYRRIAGALARAGVDVLLAETMSCAREATAAARAARGAAQERELWVSWTLAEDTSGTLRSGERVEDAVASLDAEGLLPSVGALLFNCSHVDSTSAALPRLRAALPREYGDIRIGAYANAFVSALGDGKGTDYEDGCTPHAYAHHALDVWVDEHGASIVGGCCGIFPEHIQELSRRARASREDRSTPIRR